MPLRGGTQTRGKISESASHRDAMWVEAEPTPMASHRDAMWVEAETSPPGSIFCSAQLTNISESKEENHGSVEGFGSATTARGLPGRAARVFAPTAAAVCGKSSRALRVTTAGRKRPSRTRVPGLRCGARSSTNAYERVCSANFLPPHSKQESVTSADSKNPKDL